MKRKTTVINIIEQQLSQSSISTELIMLSRLSNGGGTNPWGEGEGGEQILINPAIQ